MKYYVFVLLAVLGSSLGFTILQRNANDYEANSSPLHEIPASPPEYPATHGSQQLLNLFYLTQELAAYRQPSVPPTKLDQLVGELREQPFQQELHHLLQGVDGFEEMPTLVNGRSNSGQNTYFVNDQRQLIPALQASLNAINLDGLANDDFRSKIIHLREDADKVALDVVRQRQELIGELTANSVPIEKPRTIYDVLGDIFGMQGESFEELYDVAPEDAGRSDSGEVDEFWVVVDDSEESPSQEDFVYEYVILPNMSSEEVDPYEDSEEAPRIDLPLYRPPFISRPSFPSTSFGSWDNEVKQNVGAADFDYSAVPLERPVFYPPFIPRPLPPHYSHFPVEPPRIEIPMLQPRPMNKPPPPQLISSPEHPVTMYNYYQPTVPTIFRPVAAVTETDPSSVVLPPYDNYPPSLWGQQEVNVPNTTNVPVYKQPYFTAASAIITGANVPFETVPVHVSNTVIEEPQKPTLPGYVQNATWNSYKPVINQGIPLVSNVDRPASVIKNLTAEIKPSAFESTASLSTADARLEEPSNQWTSEKAVVLSSSESPATNHMSTTDTTIKQDQNAKKPIYQEQLEKAVNVIQNSIQEQQIKYWNHEAEKVFPYPFDVRVGIQELSKPSPPPSTTISIDTVSSGDANQSVNSSLDESVDAVVQNLNEIMNQMVATSNSTVGELPASVKAMISDAIDNATSESVVNLPNATMDATKALIGIGDKSTSEVLQVLYPVTKEAPILNSTVIVSKDSIPSAENDTLKIVAIPEEDEQTEYVFVENQQGHVFPVNISAIENQEVLKPPTKIPEPHFNGFRPTENEQNVASRMDTELTPEKDDTDVLFWSRPQSEEFNHTDALFENEDLVNSLEEAAELNQNWTATEADNSGAEVPESAVEVANEDSVPHFVDHFDATSPKDVILDPNFLVNRPESMFDFAPPYNNQADVVFESDKLPHPIDVSQPADLIEPQEVKSLPVPAFVDNSSPMVTISSLGSQSNVKQANVNGNDAAPASSSVAVDSSIPLWVQEREIDDADTTVASNLATTTETTVSKPGQVDHSWSKTNDELVEQAEFNRDVLSRIKNDMLQVIDLVEEKTGYFLSSLLSQQDLDELVDQLSEAELKKLVQDARINRPAVITALQKYLLVTKHPVEEENAVNALESLKGGELPETDDGYFDKHYNVESRTETDAEVFGDLIKELEKEFSNNTKRPASESSVRTNKALKDGAVLDLKNDLLVEMNKSKEIETEREEDVTETAELNLEHDNTVETKYKSVKKNLSATEEQEENDVTELNFEYYSTTETTVKDLKENSTELDEVETTEGTQLNLENDTATEATSFQPDSTTRDTYSETVNADADPQLDNGQTQTTSSDLETDQTFHDQTFPDRTFRDQTFYGGSHVEAQSVELDRSGIEAGSLTY